MHQNTHFPRREFIFSKHKNIVFNRIVQHRPTYLWLQILINVLEITKFPAFHEKVLFVQVPRPLCAHLLSRCHLINSKLEGKPRMYKDSISLRLRLDLLLCLSPTFRGAQCPLTLWRRKTQIIKSSFRNAKGVDQPVGSNKLTMFYICQVPHPCHRPPLSRALNSCQQRSSDKWDIWTSRFLTLVRLKVSLS